MAPPSSFARHTVPVDFSDSSIFKYRISFVMPLRMSRRRTLVFASFDAVYRRYYIFKMSLTLLNCVWMKERTKRTQKRSNSAVLLACSLACFSFRCLLAPIALWFFMATVSQIIEHEDYNEAVLHHKAWMEGPQPAGQRWGMSLAHHQHSSPQEMNIGRRAHEATLLWPHRI
jgi:hypothetical protein